MARRARALRRAALAAVAAVGTYAIAWHYHEPAVAVAPAFAMSRRPITQGEVSLLLLGDLALTEQAPVDALEPTRALVESADLAIANLEGPISNGATPFPLWKEYLVRTSPKNSLALAQAGLDIVTLANNHVMDFGTAGLSQTRATLAGLEIASAGAGASLAEARRGVVAGVGDVRIGVLAYCERQWLWDVYVRQFAGRTRAGVAPLSERALSEDIRRLRGQVDVLVVALHGGKNYAPPQEWMLTWSRRAVELGADLVVGHHAHVAHPVALHHRKAMLLGLGNYAFGTLGHPDLEYGLAARVVISGRVISRIDLYPLDVQNRRVAYRPRGLSDPELSRALEAMRSSSASLGAKLDLTADHATLALDGNAS